MRRRTAEIASPVVVVHGQNPDPFLGRHLCDRRHGTDLRVRDLGGPYVRGGLDGRCAHHGGRSRSFRSVPGPRDGVAQRQLWTAGRSVSRALCC
jgi:hypothetical protein